VGGARGGVVRLRARRGQRAGARDARTCGQAARASGVGVARAGERWGAGSGGASVGTGYANCMCCLLARIRGAQPARASV
jgi:hypothetical protein